MLSIAYKNINLELLDGIKRSVARAFYLPSFPLVIYTFQFAFNPAFCRGSCLGGNCIYAEWRENALIGLIRPQRISARAAAFRSSPLASRLFTNLGRPAFPQPSASRPPE